MKVGIVTTWFERGAAYVSHQYKELLEPECEVFIYARGGELDIQPDEKWHGSEVTYGKKRYKGTTRIDFKDFKNWIEKKGIETVLFNEQQWWPIVKQARSLGIKIGAYVDYYTERTIRLFRLYDFLICNTKRHYSAFSWHPQVFYIPWGTDTDLFQPKSFDLVESGCVTFFHSGGMSPVSRKGTDMVIMAFKKIAHLKAKLVIHTQVELDSRLSKTEKGILQELIRSGKANIISKTVTAPGLYHMGDVYVYPTKLEGIGLTILEALAVGLPVIVPDNAPMNEFVDNEVGDLVRIERYYSRSDGYYWPMCQVSVSDLARSMKRFVEKDIVEIKRKARKTSILNYNWADRKNDVLDIFLNTQSLGVSQEGFSYHALISASRPNKDSRFPRLQHLLNRVMYKN